MLLSPTGVYNASNCLISRHRMSLSETWCFDQHTNYINIDKRSSDFDKSIAMLYTALCDICNMGSMLFISSAVECYYNMVQHRAIEYNKAVIRARHTSNFDLQTYPSLPSHRMSNVITLTKIDLVMMALNLPSETNSRLMGRNKAIQTVCIRGIVHTSSIYKRIRYILGKHLKHRCIMRCIEITVNNT